MYIVVHVDVWLWIRHIIFSCDELIEMSGFMTTTRVQHNFEGRRNNRHRQTPVRLYQYQYWTFQLRIMRFPIHTRTSFSNQFTIHTKHAHGLYYTMCDSFYDQIVHWQSKPSVLLGSTRLYTETCFIVFASPKNVFDRKVKTKTILLKTLHQGQK